MVRINNVEKNKIEYSFIDWINETEENKLLLKTCKNEEELKIKLLVPFLTDVLSYDKNNEIAYNGKISVTIGTKTHHFFDDVELLVDGEIQIIIDTKNPNDSINPKDILQVNSYAKLCKAPYALYGIVTNGYETVVTDISTGRQSNKFPSKKELLSKINKGRRDNIKEINLESIKSILYTINNSSELYKAISKCKDSIEKKGLIRSDQSFKEMTKILLVKMHEERRRLDGQPYRFGEEVIKINASHNHIKEIDYFNKLFIDAKKTYPGIYQDDDISLAIKDNDCLLEVIRNIENYSFIGTGDDIKGEVYEIFLKSSLRGDMDQYFTPRPIVDFMVKYADPEVGEKVLDPACGSGGFLIQAFSHVNNKIVNMNLSEKDAQKKFDNLTESCLWGNEADYELHILAKINMIMHGDGWNNIKQGDTLISSLPKNYFDLILENPPFTIPYNYPNVLENYEMGKNDDGKVKQSEELDILFVEKSLELLKEGKEMYIILPEGLLNLKSYDFFRKWLLSKADIILSVSLPRGAFSIGSSATKACILGLRKKSINLKDKPKYVFVGNAEEIGYFLGKKEYKEHNMNDLSKFIEWKNEIFNGIKRTNFGGECGWIDIEDISYVRFDGRYLLNMIARKELQNQFKKIVPLKDICTIKTDEESPQILEMYNYLEICDISPVTGTITNVRKVQGINLAGKYYKFSACDIIFSRINPRKSRVAIAPPITGYGITSKEAYILNILDDNPYINPKYKYALCAILQSSTVQNQMIRLTTGSSSSRERIYPEEFLNEVYVPVLPIEVLEVLHNNIEKITKDLWDISQNYLLKCQENQQLLGENFSLEDIRSI